MPILPEKSLLSLLIKPTDKELNKRRMELEKYLNVPPLSLHNHISNDAISIGAMF